MTIHTLEQQLAAICEQHALEYLSVNISRDSEGKWYFYGSAQAIVNGERLCGCTQGYDRQLVGEAIESAITNLNSKRSPVDTPALSPMGEAA